MPKVIDVHYEIIETGFDYGLLKDFVKVFLVFLVVALLFLRRL
jgi:hypothetical protein